MRLFSGILVHDFKATVLPIFFFDDVTLFCREEIIFDFFFDNDLPTLVRFEVNSIYFENAASKKESISNFSL